MKNENPLAINLKLDLNEYEFMELKKIYKSDGKAALKKKIEGALNNWILEMLLDQEEE